MSESVRVFRVELTAGFEGFKAIFESASKSAKQLGDGLDALGKKGSTALKGMSFTEVNQGFELVAKGVEAVASVFENTVGKTLEYADSLGDLSAASGHTVEWLQQAKFAAEQSGATLEDVTKGSNKLALALVQGSEKTDKAVRALGLSLADLKKSSPDEQMNKVLKAISQVENPTLRTAIAMQLLGKGGAALIPMAGDFDTLRKRAEELGIVMSEKDVTAAKALADGLKAMESAFGGLVRSVGAAIVSNKSLHILVDGLATIFGNLARAVNGNRQGMLDLVSGGVVLLAKGLVLMADVAQVAVDVWDGLRLTWSSAYLAAINLALGMAKVDQVLAALTGDDQASVEAKNRIALLEAEKLAVGRNADAIITSNTEKTNALQNFRSQLVALEANVEAAAGQEVELGKSARGTAGDLDIEGEAAKKLADAVTKLADELDKAFAEAGAKGLTGLEGAFAKVDADAMKWSQDLQKLVKDGLDAKSAAAFGQEIEALTAKLKANALEAERQKVLGKSFQDDAKEAENLRAVLDATGNALQSLTPSSLTALEAKLTKMAQDGAPIAGTLDRVRAQMDALGLATTQTEEHSKRWGAAMEWAGMVSEAAEDRIAEKAEKLQKTFEAVGGAFEIIGQIGTDVGGKVGSVLSQVGELGANIAEGLASGDLTKAFDQVLGLIAKGIGSLFHKEEQDVNKVRDSFISAHGGWQALQASIAKATNEDLLKKLFDAKTLKEFNAAVSEISGLLDSQKAAQDALKEATDRYGFSISELGPAMQRQELDTQAAQLLQDFKLLTASGIDVGTVIGKMGPNLVDFVNTSKAAGQALPEAMRPMIDDLIKSGQLLDENGNAFTSAEDAGISFTETLTEGLSRAVDAIEKLVAALTGIPPVKIPVTVDNQTGGGDGATHGGHQNGQDVPHLARGGIVTMPTMALIGENGPEAIVPLPLMGAAGTAFGGGPHIVNHFYSNIDESPWHSTESREQLRDYTLGLRNEQLVRNVADAVAEGHA